MTPGTKRIYRHLLFLCPCLPYLLIAYHYPRHEVVPLQVCFFALFSCYAVLLCLKGISWRHILFYGTLYRLLFLPSLPTLSDDFYRFLWDGMLWQQGVNPFSQPPAHYFSAVGEGAALSEWRAWYEAMNSKAYFTIYPPVPQLIFWLSSFFSGQTLYALIFMRFVQLAAECGTVCLTIRWLKKKNLALEKVAYYTLNPLVIIEGAGNLHFEGLLLFFLISAALSLDGISLGTSKSHHVAWSLAGAVATKLHPLILLPCFLRRLPQKKRFVLAGYFFSALLCAFFLLSINSPHGLIQWLCGMKKSVFLYFQHFEFNASLYLLFKELLPFLGCPPTQAGWVTGALSAAAILFLSCKCCTRPIFHSMTLLYGIYLLGATTLHPWYLIPLVGFCPFTSIRFPLLWSYTVCWSYVGYTTDGYNHPYLWQVAEYTTVTACFLYETLRHRKSTHTGRFNLGKVPTE